MPAAASAPAKLRRGRSGAVTDISASDRPCTYTGH